MSDSERIVKDPPHESAREQEVLELRRELATQWEFNHTEHCGHLGEPYPHRGRCNWPMPEVLTRQASAEEVYQTLLGRGDESA